MIFWLVGFTTFLSMKVERQMIPQVTTASADTGMSIRSTPKLPLDCLQVDEAGMHLYSIYEGAGWEAGSRVREVFDYTVAEDGLEMDNGWGDYVRYASKPLKPGGLVEVVRGGERVPDHWLAVFPEDAPEIAKLPEGITIEGRAGRALLLSVAQDAQPFMEGRAKSQVPELAEAHVYSFNDMRRFLGNLPLCALLLGALLAALALWGFAWYQAKNLKLYRAYIWGNLLLGLAVLAFVPLILHFIGLPSSLLPQEEITDFGWYFRELVEFFQAAESLSGGLEAVEAVLRARLWAVVWSAAAVLLSAALAAGMMIAQEAWRVHRFIQKLRRENRVAYSTKS